MAILNVNLTRVESMNLKKSLQTAKRGHKLLKDKLDELIKKLIQLVQENHVLRIKLDKMLANAYQNFMLAEAVISEEYLAESLIIPKKSIGIDISEKSIMSVKIPKYNFNISDNNDNSAIYGFAYTTSELDMAIDKFSDLTEILLRLAENEKSIDLIAQEIEKTRRRVNALENVMIPNYIDTIKYIGMKLAENERSNTSRLMKVKEMITKKKQ